jgi:serine/threonine-protein kinase PpkA
MRRRPFVLSCLAAPLLSRIAAAQARTPLLMEGKRSLYQRVIVRPGAMLLQGVGAAAPRPVPGFSVFYVYDRQKVVNGQAGDWVQVGRGADGHVDGWLPADKAIDWPHTMVAAFTNPSGRAPVLFLESEVEERRLILDAKAGEQAERMRQAVLENNPGPVVAVEPQKFVDISKNFYLLPILKATLIDREVGGSLRLLEVISATAEQQVPATPAKPVPAAEYKAAVVFLIDTTLSMQPYIDRTRNAVRSIVQAIGQSPASQNFRFGLIAYRDSKADNPGLEYDTWIVAKPDFSHSLEDFEKAIASVRESPVSSTGFDEDPIGGLKAAIDGIDWTAFSAKFVVLITDAGARKSTHPFSMTRMDIPEIHQLLQSSGIAVFAIHLLTPAGKARRDHEPARAQYEQLTRFNAADSLYFPVPDGATDAFAKTVNALSASLIRHAAETAGHPVANVGEPADPRMEQQVAIVNEAMRLAWLGRIENARAPDIVHAFTTDRDLAAPTIISLDVRVLLTRNQLSDLRDALKRILAAGLAGQMQPEKFFVALRTAFAAAARDPDRIPHLDRIGGVIGEYIEGLPYQSEIMDITEADWLAMGALAQSTVLNDVAAKLRLYEEYAAHADLWVDLSGTRTPGEAMFPVPIEALP